MSDHSRVAIVTGATSGIGEATARTFLEAGYAVVGNGRNVAKLAELERELGASFTGVAGDAAAPETVDRLLSAAREVYGEPASIVVVNAGRGLGGAVTNADPDQFEAVLSTNVTAALRLMQRSAAEMLSRQEGAFPKTAADILVVGSVVGRHISPFSAVYGATKFAVHALTEGLRREVGPKGIRVSLVEPGIVVSGFQAAAGYSDELTTHFEQRFGPLLSPSDVAAAIAFMVAQPPHVHIGDLVMRPTRQDYP